MSVLSIGELLDLGGSASTAGLVPYSALEYNANNEISGISGSAIAGGIESSVVSSIVSSMVSGKADQSSMDECCSSMSSVISSKLDASASSMFQPSGQYLTSVPDGYVTTADISGLAYESAVSSKQDALTFGYSDSYISSINGSALVGEGAGTGIEYSGIAPVVVNNTSHEISADTINFVLDSSLSGNLSNSQYTLSINKEAYSPVQVVSSTSLATANGVIYVVIQ